MDVDEDMNKEFAIEAERVLQTIPAVYHDEASMTFVSLSPNRLGLSPTLNLSVWGHQF